MWLSTRHPDDQRRSRSCPLRDLARRADGVSPDAESTRIDGEPARVEREHEGSKLADISHHQTARSGTRKPLTCTFAQVSEVRYLSRRVTHNPEVAGSNPAPATHFRRSAPCGPLLNNNC
jgi:hypothetical protein